MVHCLYIVRNLAHRTVDICYCQSNGVEAFGIERVIGDFAIRGCSVVEVPMVGNDGTIGALRRSGIELNDQRWISGRRLWVGCEFGVQTVR